MLLVESVVYVLLTNGKRLLLLEKRWRIMNNALKNNVLMAAMLTLVAVLLGCRSKLSTQRVGGSGASDNSTIAYVEAPGELSSEKVQFQTRGTVSLTVGESVLAGASSFSLYNDTSGSVFFENQSIDAANLFFTSLDSIKLSLALNMTDNEGNMRFNYGDNLIRVQALVGAEKRYTTSTIKLYDFDVLGIAAISFDKNSQIENGFQGWANVFATPTVRGDNEGHVLTSGWINMINN